MRKQTPELALASLTQAVRTRVPKHLPSLWVIERQIGNLTVTFQHTTQIPEFFIDLRNDNIGTQFFRQIPQKEGGRSFPGLGGDSGSVSITKVNSHVDFRVWFVLDLLELLLPQFFE